MRAIAKEGKFGVQNFNDQNCELWKMQTEDYLSQKDILLRLGGKVSKSTTMKDKEWEVLDRKALGTIQLS